MSDDPLGALVPGWYPPAEAGGGDGPLAGLRVVVKDVIDVAEGWGGAPRGECASRLSAIPAAAWEARSIRRRE